MTLQPLTPGLRTLALCFAIAACADEPSPGPSAQRAVLPGAAPADKATFARMVGELGIQVDPDVPEADSAATS